MIRVVSQKKQAPTAAVGERAKQVQIESLQVLVFRGAHHHRREYIHAQVNGPSKLGGGMEWNGWVPVPGHVVTQSPRGGSHATATMLHKRHLALTRGNINQADKSTIRHECGVNSGTLDDASSRIYSKTLQSSSVAFSTVIRYLSWDFRSRISLSLLTHSQF